MAISLTGKKDDNELLGTFFAGKSSVNFLLLNFWSSVLSRQVHYGTIAVVDDGRMGTMRTMGVRLVMVGVGQSNIFERVKKRASR